MWKPFFACGLHKNRQEATFGLWAIVDQPLNKESASKKKMPGNKLSKSTLMGLDGNYQYTINTSLVTLHMEGILMAGCTLIP